MNNVQELRNAVKDVLKQAQRVELEKLANDLEMAIYNFRVARDAETLRIVNGLWAAGARLLASVTPEGNDPKEKAVA
jgi:hypothetical protein